MTIEQFKYIDELVKCGSLNKAAENMFLSQSSMTRQIAAIEKETGFPIFLRSTSGVSLTAQGQVFYQQTKNIVPIFENAVESARSVRSGKRTVRIGTNKYNRRQIINACRHVNELDPALDFVFISCRVSEAPDKLRANEIDIMLLGEICKDTEFHTVPVYNSFNSLLTPETSDLYDKDFISFKDLTGHTLLLHKSNQSSGNILNMKEIYIRECPGINIIHFKTTDEADTLCLLNNYLISTISLFDTQEGLKNIPVIDAPRIPIGIFCLKDNEVFYRDVMENFRIYFREHYDGRRCELYE